MYGQRCNTSKLYLHRNTPKTYLSPANKYGQRSFSASSLSSHSQAPLPGSLREQIRLDTFKRTIADSKLNKTSHFRTTLKVDGESFRSDTRAEMRQLQRQNAILREENSQLKQQKSSDMLLISKQNQLLSRLEQELIMMKEYPSKEQCECYLLDQFREKIKTLQSKVVYLEEEKQQFKNEIRELVIQQQHLKAQVLDQEKKKIQINQRDKQKERERNRLKEWEDMKEEQIYRDRKEKKMKKISHTAFPEEKKGEGVLRYMEYLKNIRNREIDEIQNILKE